MIRSRYGRANPFSLDKLQTMYVCLPSRLCFVNKVLAKYNTSTMQTGNHHLRRRGSRLLCNWEVRQLYVGAEDLLRFLKEIGSSTMGSHWFWVQKGHGKNKQRISPSQENIGDSEIRSILKIRIKNRMWIFKLLTFHFLQGISFSYDFTVLYRSSSS